MEHMLQPGHSIRVNGVTSWRQWWGQKKMTLKIKVDKLQWEEKGFKTLTTGLWVKLIKHQQLPVVRGWPHTHVAKRSHASNQNDTVKGPNMWPCFLIAGPLLTYFGKQRKTHLGILGEDVLHLSGSHSWLSTRLYCVRILPDYRF